MGRTRRDRAMYQAGDETSFGDFMTQGDGFDDMPLNVQAGYPYGPEPGQNGEVIAPGVSEFAEPVEREALQPRFNPAPRTLDTRGNAPSQRVSHAPDQSVDQCWVRNPWRRKHCPTTCVRLMRCPCLSWTKSTTNAHTPPDQRVNDR